MENIQEPFLEGKFVNKKSFQRKLAYSAYELFLEKQFKNAGIVNPEFIGYNKNEFVLRIENFRKIRSLYLESETGNINFSMLENYEENGGYFIVVSFSDSGYLPQH